MKIIRNEYATFVMVLAILAVLPFFFFDLKVFHKLFNTSCDIKCPMYNVRTPTKQAAPIESSTAAAAAAAASSAETEEIK
jgi:hypothetical protein